jgi:acyl carrier protein
MLEQPSNIGASVLNASALREALVEEVGIDAAELSSQPDAALADLGLDSMAQVELAVVLKDRFGVGGLPEEVATMSFTELAGRLCRPTAA